MLNSPNLLCLMVNVQFDLINRVRDKRKGIRFTLKVSNHLIVEK